ncbi:FAD:protein FMN transferase [Piscinibacter sp.]|uniref:FAD:protein FMN transferase n=1 Tax=Piscinibacter sp. TaxID=1903157 RepID=UPI002C340D56|nr:FAD:protein FMN transferase [Albitalea sp.]HUG21062.1 FAD:protein FMN transferase [Albitalea sp.]
MPIRRRFLSIVATCAALAPLSVARAAAASQVSVWRGTALGALATMTLVHPDRATARAQLEECVREVQRLEAIFSLYRADSAISRLNNAGELREPPQELVELLSFGLALSQRSAGAFDPTVQPLYRLYATHFATPGAAPGGPPAPAIARVLRLVDGEAIDLRPDLIRLRRPGMAITLNGVAQGFITDRVADMLRAGGFTDVLVDLGEARALGQRPGGGSWRAGIADPRQPARTILELPLGSDRGALPALATSAGHGTRFGPDPRVHHLLDPHTGRSANHYLSVSVAAARATLADGLSTTLAIMSPARAAAMLRNYPSTRAYLVDASGQLTEQDTARVMT